MFNTPPRNQGFDIVRTTEEAAIQAGRMMGYGEPRRAESSAAKAMRDALDLLPIRGHIIIGEEPADGSGQGPLSSGQEVGTGEGREMDVALDPIDGRRLLASGQSGAISVAALTEHSALWSPKAGTYMQKIVVDREVAEALVPECMDAPAAWTLSLVARVKEKDVRDLIVFMLDRPRHQNLIDEIREAGARVMLRVDGDIAGAILAASGLGKADILMGIGGVQEGIIAACAVKSLGGAMLVRLAPQSDQEREKLEAEEIDTERILNCDDIVRSNQIFFAATGITDGPLFDGVQYSGDRIVTQSMVLRCETMTRRFIQAEHYRG